MSSEGFIINSFILIVILNLSVLIAFEFSLVSVAVFLPILIPACLILLRINIFSEDNILPETEIGYFPIFSYILSFIASIGFFMIFPAFTSNEGSFWFYIIVFVLASIGAIVPVIPDQINKLLPYDIRNTKGQKLLVAITLVLVISLWLFVIIYYISIGASPLELTPARFGGG
ncbi:hypothetical protein [Methanobrevibacter arboriphilus]|uniref:hypothetical protein n=1 Tax=Methanobrevibacter arboriphilus TaxID=39441 RepID=UPI000B320A88|nr:hypothetical protein [Methanobrevibacter arboriphilus]